MPDIFFIVRIKAVKMGFIELEVLLFEIYGYGINKLAFAVSQEEIAGIGTDGSMNDL